MTKKDIFSGEAAPATRRAYRLYKTDFPITVNRMSFKALFLVYAGCLAFFSSIGQQGNNWYFGAQAGISFNGSPPIALADGVINTLEGCSAISDDTGQLLFYTDGVTVWNRQHRPMPNGTGLHGHSSTTNSAIVVPKPGSNTIYYIFTADAIEHGNVFGYNYSEVNMTLNGGLGDITANKNVLLYAPCTEKLTATRAANGIDAWVITKNWGNNEWRVFKVDCNGVHTNPVISNAGAIHDELFMGFHGGASGGAKMSPDGSFLANTRPYTRTWELFHFDNSTGIISNALSFNANYPYGVEFSPNSKLVYLNNTSNNSNISQFDLSVYNAAVIQASEITVGSPIPIAGALQLGPDNKIYCANTFSIGHSFLAVINAPDVRGPSCNYADAQVDLAPGVSSYGLPAFMADLLVHPRTDFSYAHDNSNCTALHFTGSSTLSGPLSWQWDFGDGARGSGQHILHTYAPGDTVLVRLTVTTSSVCGGMVTTAKKIIIPAMSGAAVNAGRDTTVAIGQPLQLEATGAASYTWSPATGLDNPFSDRPVARPGTDMTYYLTGTTPEGCTGFDTLHIKVYKGPAIYVPNAFTPNGDGANDILLPIVPGIKKLDYFSVYNRAGQRVFNTTTPGKGWDGRLNGIPQPPGAYAWVLQLQDYLGNTQRQKGVSILLRQ